MIHPIRGTAIISLAGRDKSRYMVVMSAEDNYVYVADGDLRSVESPKKKNIKHIAVTNTVFEEESLLNDKSLIRVIKERFNAQHR